MKEMICLECRAAKNKDAGTWNEHIERVFQCQNERSGFPSKSSGRGLPWRPGG